MKDYSKGGETKVMPGFEPKPPYITDWEWSITEAAWRGKLVAEGIPWTKFKHLRAQSFDRSRCGADALHYLEVAAQGMIDRAKYDRKFQAEQIDREAGA